MQVPTTSHWAFSTTLADAAGSLSLSGYVSPARLARSVYRPLSRRDTKLVLFMEASIERIIGIAIVRLSTIEGRIVLVRGR